MTPAARYAAAIAVLDDVLAGESAERTLTTWARKNRFAGSKDRAAIRNHVYDALRGRRSLCALGGDTSGRGAILGLLRRDGIAPDTVFGAGGYGPAALTPQEAAGGSEPDTDAARADLPDWLWPIWQDALGDDAMDVAQAMRHRAGVFLRVNLSRATLADAIDALAADDIVAVHVPDVKTALKVIENERKVAASDAFASGLVEVQDTASQIAIHRLQDVRADRILDFCAGGGGKALALADLHDAAIFAHDIDAARTADIAPRAARAGVKITTLRTAGLAQAAPFGLVLCDAPCSGSGTWRRAPDAKWRLTRDQLDHYGLLQSGVLDQAQGLVAPGGVLAYATCSVLTQENDDIVHDFLARRTEFSLVDRMQLLPGPDHDGFYLAIMRKAQP